MIVCEPRTSMMDFADTYRTTLLDNVMPFWLRHGMDAEFGGIQTCLDRQGNVIDSDKSVWFQGRAGWMFASLCLKVEPRPEWLAAALSCVKFARDHCFSSSGKMYFTVTREGMPLRMRRYIYSEAFASIAFAAFARVSGESSWAELAEQCFTTYLRYSFEPGVMSPKAEPTRLTKGIGALMITIVTAQELREHLGDKVFLGRTCSQWITHCIEEIRRDFFKPELAAVMETVMMDGSICPHHDGLTLNPGHAIECAWFIMHEGRHRKDEAFIDLGIAMLDCMWERGWDKQHGGLLYFTHLHGAPVQEYWHEMKFWWPQNEVIIATLLAWKLRGEMRHAQWHTLAHEWSFSRFTDPEFGEWYGYLRRDGTPSSLAKGTIYKGPFHLPRMLLYCWQLLDQPREAS